MTDTTDRRIQLRESIHQLVVNAAAARCVTPAALVSMVMYDYLRTCGELEPVAITTVTKAPPAPTPTPRVKPKSVWDATNDEELAELLARDRKAHLPSELQAAVADWGDDEDDD